MDSPHIVKVDSKGRILIPVNIRNNLEIDEGTEIIVVPEMGEGHFKIMPISRNTTAELKVMLGGSPSALASVADALSANAFNIIISESKRIARELTEWKIIVDLPDNNGSIDTLRDVLTNVEDVKSIDVTKR